MTELAAANSALAPDPLPKLRRVLLSLCATNVGWIVGGTLLTVWFGMGESGPWSLRAHQVLAFAIAAYCAFAWVFAVVPFALTVPKEHVICSRPGAPLFGAVCGALSFAVLATLAGQWVFFQPQEASFVVVAAVVGGLTWALFAWGLRRNAARLAQASLTSFVAAALGPGLALWLALFVAMR